MVDTPPAAEDAARADAEVAGWDPSGTEADAGCDWAGAEALAAPDPPLLA